MLVFEELEETGEPKEKSLGGKLNARTNSLFILNPHMASPVGICLYATALAAAQF